MSARTRSENLKRTPIKKERNMGKMGKKLIQNERKIEVPFLSSVFKLRAGTYSHCTLGVSDT